MIGWFDGGAGASGDMLLGAFVGAGVPLEVPSASIGALDLGVTLRSEQVQRAGLDATRIHVEVPDATVVRHLPDILELFAQLDAGVRTIATAVFERLADAEFFFKNDASRPLEDFLSKLNTLTFEAELGILVW